MTSAPADPAAVPALRSAWDVGRWEEVEALPLGKSQHWRVTTDRGRFVLRRSYRSKAASDVRFEHELVAHLRRRGFPGPVYVPTTAGEPCALVDARLWRMSEFVAGRPARIADPADAAVAGATLARYHGLVEGFEASVPTPRTELIPEALRARLETAAGLARSASLPAADPLVAGLDATLARAGDVCTRLEDLYPALAPTTVHAGCRRGSTLFDDGGGLAVVLDFDSARREARVLDVAVGLFDFAKLYGEPGSPDYKVHLDPGSARAFTAAYRSESPLGAAEEEAIPLLILAKRLKRALGRYLRLLSGQELSPGDRAKIALEEARVRSLESGVGALRQAATT